MLRPQPSRGALVYGARGALASWAMPCLSADTKAILASMLSKATPVEHLCPCYDEVTVAIQPRGIFSRMSDYTILDGDIVPHGTFLQPSIMSQSDRKNPCNHSGETTVRILTCKWDEPLVIHSDKILIYNAKVIHNQRPMMIDARYIQTGLLDVSQNDSPRDYITCGELFAGGFSGWSHAVAAISSEVIPMRHVWAVDHDFVAMEMYSKSHANTVHFKSSQEAHNYRCNDIDDADDICKAFQCDVRTPWFLSHIKAGSADIALWSPPCQPWS